MACLRGEGRAGEGREEKRRAMMSAEIMIVVIITVSCMKDGEDCQNRDYTRGTAVVVVIITAGVAIGVVVAAVVIVEAVVILVAVVIIVVVVPSIMAIGSKLPPCRPDRSPRSAKGRTSPPPTVFELPVWGEGGGGWGEYEGGV